MPKTPEKKVGSPRTTLAGVSTLLLFGLLVSVAVEPLRPVVRELQREATAERAAVRQLTDSLARAVRDLVGADTQRPAARVTDPSTIRERFAAATTRPEIPVATVADVRRPRVELLDLPPPLA